MGTEKQICTEGDDAICSHYVTKKYRLSLKCERALEDKWLRIVAETKDDGKEQIHHAVLGPCQYMTHKYFFNSRTKVLSSAVRKYHHLTRLHAVFFMYLLVFVFMSYKFVD
jgi:hypothetical protein